MFPISQNIELQDKVLDFLLEWKRSKDPSLVFTLRRHPEHLLEKGQWFLGNDIMFHFSLWTGLDRVGKAQNISVQIKEDSVELVFSSEDDEKKAALLQQMTIGIGGFFKTKDKALWTKTYDSKDIFASLTTFLEKDSATINQFIKLQKQIGYNPVFEKAFNPLNTIFFEMQLRTIQDYRKSRAVVNMPKPIRRRSLVVQSMKMVNISLFEDCVIQFGERATCLIGDNGGGKTSILRAVALGMVGTGSPLIDTRGELQHLPRIIGVNQDATKQYAPNGRIDITYQFNGTTFEGDRSNVIPFSFNSNTGRVDFDMDRIDGKGFGLPIGDDESGIDGDGELPLLVIGYPQRYGKRPDGTDIKRRSPRPNAYDIIPLIHDTEDNRIENLKIWVSESWNGGDAKRRLVTDLFGIISKILTVDANHPFTVAVKSAVSSNKIIVTTPDNPNGIPFELLSTGLNNLFGWIGHLVSRMHEAYTESDNPIAEPAVVLVDEIDNYLHPMVQVGVVNVLLEKFPKVQFIFTSHSPIILASLQHEKVRAYRVESGAITEILHFSGKTIHDILLHEYGVSKRPAQAIQKKIDAMDSAILKSDFDKANSIYEELLPVLGEDDPAMLDAIADLN